MNNNLLQLRDEHNKRKKKIEKRLKEFQNTTELQWKDELLFCILTPQSNGKRCWQAILELNKNNFKNIEKTLSQKTRFHKTKAKHLQKAQAQWLEVEKAIKTLGQEELRDFLVNNVYGIGMKEASHFIRNIGKNNNQLAILDRHILRNLAKYKVIKDPEISLTSKVYKEIENKMKTFSQRINIPLDHLDLLFWQAGTGEIFK